MPQACPNPESPGQPVGSAAPAPPDGLARLVAAYRRRLEPADEAEEAALAELARSLWRRSRLAELEMRLLDRLAESDDATLLPRLDTIVRYAARLARGRDAVEAELLRLRRERPRVEPAAPASSATAPSPRHAAPEPPAAAAPQRPGPARPGGAIPRPGRPQGPAPTARAAAHAPPETGSALPGPAAPVLAGGRAGLLARVSETALRAGLDPQALGPPALPDG